MIKEEVIARCFSFLESIGIAFEEKSVDKDTFLPGIEICNGILHVDRNQLKFPGDLLHEAGHIAVTSPAERDLLNGEVTENDEQKRGEEMAVLLWSYFAAQEAGIDPRVVFHPEGYKGESQWLLENFSGGNYIGLPLLEWMSIARRSENGEVKIISWLRS